MNQNRLTFLEINDSEHIDVQCAYINKYIIIYVLFIWNEKVLVIQNIIQSKIWIIFSVQDKQNLTFDIANRESLNKIFVYIQTRQKSKKSTINQTFYDL